MSKEYYYVGPKNLLDLAQKGNVQTPITNVQDIISWIQNTGQKFNKQREIVATFVIDANHKLWIAERGIEHVVCARGASVLAAGEITFLSENNFIEISEITNQSTGYCPEPESWKAVNQILKSLQIKYPTTWTMQFVFRRCPNCRTTNLVKDEWYFCGVCESELPQTWNF